MRKQYRRVYSDFWKYEHKHYTLCISLDELQILRRNYDGKNNNNKLQNFDLINGHAICEGVKLALTTIVKEV
jgi:hypothetical protein